MPLREGHPPRKYGSAHIYIRARDQHVYAQVALASMQTGKSTSEITVEALKDWLAKHGYTEE